MGIGALELEIEVGGELCGHGVFLFPLLAFDFKRREQGSNAGPWVHLYRNQLGEWGEGFWCSIFGVSLLCKL